MPLPFEQCPNFMSCCCNDCPLDAQSALHAGRRFALPDEDTCRATRATRERLAVAHGLDPRTALLPHEAIRDQRKAGWNRLTPEQRARRTAGLRRGAGSPLRRAGDGLPAAAAAA